MSELNKRREREEKKGTDKIMKAAQEKSRKNKYPNGFQEKISYWTQMLNGAVANKDNDSIRRCKEKLDYFVGRQLEL